MENLNGSSNLGNLSYTGSQFQLPPRSPNLFNFPPHFSPVVRTDNSFPNPTHEFQAYHQRTSSDSILQEEQPSWLEDLLDEPKASQKEECGFKDINAGTPNECHNYEHYHEQVSHALLHNTNPCKPSDMNEFWESSSSTSAVTYLSNGFISTNDSMTTLQTSETSCTSKKSDSIVKTDQEEPFVSSTVGSDCSQTTNPQLIYVVGIVEHEMLERELARLRNLYQQQQLQQQQSTRRQSKTRDLDCQHANLFVVRHFINLKLG